MKANKYSCILLLALLMPVWCAAQLKDNTDYNIWNANKGDTFRVYGNTANVRVTADITAPLLDSLPCGTPVIIAQLEKGLDPIKGIYAPWVKVHYTLNGTGSEGYMWLGMLALGHYEKNGYRFLYGIEKITAAMQPKDKDFIPALWDVKVKVIDPAGHIADEQAVQVKGVETSASGGKLLGDMGLRNTSDILRIYFGGEACGIPTYYYYFGWTGTTLLPLPGKMEVGDAGVFYHTETFLFPKESGGQPDKIILLTEEGEADDDKVDQKGEPVFKIKKTREVYDWDGTKAKKQ